MIGGGSGRRVSTAVNQELTKCEWSVWAVVVACVLIVSQHQDRGAQEPRGTRCRIRTISSISRFYGAKSYSAKIPTEGTKTYENPCDEDEQHDISKFQQKHNKTTTVVI